MNADLRVAIERCRAEINRLAREVSTLRATNAWLHSALDEYEAEDQALAPVKPRLMHMSDRHAPHEGPPLYTAVEALNIYHANIAARGGSVLAKGALAEGEVFYGDSKGG